MAVRISTHLAHRASLTAVAATITTGLSLALLPAAVADTASTAHGVSVTGNASLGWTPTVTGTGRKAAPFSTGGPDNVVRGSASVEVRDGFARASVTGLTAGGIALPNVTITCLNGVVGAPQISGKSPDGRVTVSPGRGGIGAVMSLPGLTITAGKVSCGKTGGGGSPTSTPKPTSSNPTSPPTSTPATETTRPQPTTPGGGSPTAPPRVPAPKPSPERNPGLSVTG